MAEIESIAEIQKLARDGFDNWLLYGDVKVAQQGDLLLFDYTTAAHQAARWNFFERVSRGLMINRKTGEVVARPFDKFFYWLEGGRATRAHMVSVTEKMDGSMAVLFRTQDRYAITTRGSFTSPQGAWATEFLNAHFDLADLPAELTLIFEILYPENQIVVDYETREDLVLLAARNRFTGAYLPFFPDLYELAQKYGFSLPRVYQFNNIAQLFEATGRNETNFEGWVVEFSDGQRFKFKLDWYVERHIALYGTSG